MKKRHDEVASVARGLYELSGRIEGRDLENWCEAERIVMAGYIREEITADHKRGAKTARKKTVKKTAKDISGTGAAKKVTLLKKSPAKSMDVERT